MAIGSGKWAVILLVGLTVARAQVAEALTHHGDLYGYSLDIPADWKAIPPDVIQKVTAVLIKPGTANAPIYDAAFEPAAHETWFQYPYLTVQVIPYSRFGQGQINEDQFPEVIKHLTGMETNKVLDSTIKPDARSIFGAVNVGQPQLETASRRYLVPINMNVANIGPVRTLMAGYFGRESLVQVAVSARQKDWDAAAGPAQKIIDSFRFDPDKAYSVAEAEAHPSSRSIWHGTGEAAAVGAVLALLAYFGRKMTKSKA